MIEVCVLCHNQAEYIVDMLAALKDFHGRITYILDRCNDDSESILQANGIPYFCTAKTYRHAAGQARELGFEVIFERDNTADILFIDGDRIPVNITQTLLEKALNSNIDILLFLNQNDIRLTRHRYPCKQSGNFTRHIPSIYDNTHWLGGIYNLDNYVYTNCILFSNSFLRLASAVQDGYLFHPIMYGKYGYEDTLLGVVAMMAGYNMAFAPAESFVAGTNGSGIVNLEHRERMQKATKILLYIEKKLGRVKNF